MTFSQNPYIAGNPVGNSNAFVGRADIVREVLRIFPRPEENALVLYGQRRIGKTSVLQYLKKTLAEEKQRQYFPIYFDLQDKATFSLDAVLKDLAATIASELNFAVPNLGDNPQHYFQYQWLPQQLAQLPKGSALVLLFDEFDVLAADSAKGAGADFFPYLRQLIASDRKRLNFVFVIGRNVSDLNTIALSLFKGVPTKRVSLLDKKDTFALIRLAEQTSPLRWTEEALERVWQLTNGHAFFTQQLCSYSWEEVYDDGDFDQPEIGVEVVNQVVQEVLSASRNTLEWLWDGLPPAERVVSSALAEAGGKAVTEAELEKLLHERERQIETRELQDWEEELKEATNLLQDFDLLEPVDCGFRFRVELLRGWIAENKKLRKILEEFEAVKIYKRLVDSARRHEKEECDFYQTQELNYILEWKANFKPTKEWAMRCYGKQNDYKLAMKFLEDSKKACNRFELIEMAEKITRVGHWSIEYDKRKAEKPFENLSWSVGLYEILGKQKEDNHKPTFEEFEKMIHKEDKYITLKRLNDAIQYAIKEEKEKKPYSLYHRINVEQTNGENREFLFREWGEVRKINENIFQMIGVAQDITQDNDFLTGLPARFMFEKQCQVLLEIAKQYNHIYTLFWMKLTIIDLEEKNEKDYKEGDDLLKGVIMDLKEYLNTEGLDKGETLARVGALELAFIYINISTENEAENVKNKIGDFFAEKHKEKKYSIRIGFTFCTKENSNAKELLEKAEKSMLDVKS